MPLSPSRRLPGKPGFPCLSLIFWFAALPLSAGAVGLGDMLLTSPAGQPLEAEISVEVVTAQELRALQVGVASARTYLRNGLVRTPELDELQFEVVRGNDGGDVVRMTSPNPLAGSLAVLVEATWLRRPDWPAGRLIRIYYLGPQDLPAVGAPPRALGQGTLDTRGPIGADETLWGLANRFSAPGVHPNQILVAIFEANPRGFGGNMNGIYAGATLRIPEAVQARRLTMEEATAEAIRQLDEWLAESETGSSADREEGDPVAETTPEADVLRAELDGARQLIEAREQELLALREQLLEAQTATQAAEQAAEAARAAVPPEPRPGLRGLWVELNRAASRAVRVVAAIALGALFLIGILIGFLLGRRGRAGTERRVASRSTVAESPDQEPESQSGERSDSAVESPAAMEVDSQLDLARALTDMGDTEAAQRTLQAVVKSGNRDQRRQAESLLDKLEPASKKEKPDGEADPD